MAIKFKFFKCFILFSDITIRKLKNSNFSIAMFYYNRAEALIVLKRS